MDSQSYIFPASFAQQRLWFHDQLEPNLTVYNMPFAVRLHTRLDFSALQKSLQEIVSRHESLRTTFAAQDGRPVQVIARQLDLPLVVTDLSNFDGDKEAELQRLAHEEAGQLFDLQTGPLLRARLVRVGEFENVLMITMHHIISDGWSMGVFLRELTTLYEAFAAGAPSPLAELPIQYADYAVWQREWLQGEILEENLSFWREHLRGAPTTLDLASDRPRPPAQTFRGARRYLEIPARLADRLRVFSRRENVTLFMTLLAAFDVLLWRYSRQTDFVVVSPIASRNRSELEGLIGYFANTLALRADLSGQPTFRELLRRVRETALDAYAHQDVPFDKLVEELRPDRSLSYLPLFQVIFAFENTPQPLESSELKMKWMEVDRGTSRCDLTLFVTDNGGGLACMWEYSTDLFDGETIERIIASYQTLLESVLENPDEKIAYLKILKETDRRRLIEEWNGEATAPGIDSCMPRLFEAQAEKTPEAIAVTCGDQNLTYRELNARANQLAHYLQTRGVGPETPVGVCAERSAEMIVALLGILKAGGAYVPLDPNYPSERLAFMLEDSSVPLLLTQRRLLDKLPEGQTEIVCLDDWAALFESCSSENIPSCVTPENLAYVIYTSGSTGKPKGVEVTHRTVVHLFAATRDKLGFREGDVWTVVHSSAFDFSVWEIWGALLQGGTLIVVPLDIVQSPTEFFDLLCRERVNVLNQTPSALRELLRAREQAQEDWRVRLIVCGGDALDQELASKLAQLQLPVWNFYGPTESTVWTTCGLVAQTSVCESQTEVCATSIGRPIPDTHVYLLDEYLQPVPIGVPGELFIGGAGLARGYFKRPDLTAEKFVPNQFSNEPDARLYRTGDLARYRRNGQLEFLGRIDNQIKLRGFRIELGEIESALAEHANVAQAVATIREDRPGDKRLVAYVVAQHGAALSSTELRKHLQSSLPDYMLPAMFVFLDELPLTPNKKVDRRALPAPDESAAAPPTVEEQGPRTAVEELLADIWARVLGVERVGLHDNFFELGGHSLLATQVMSRAREAFQIDVPLRALFESPTVAGLADRFDQTIHQNERSQAPPLVAVSHAGKLPLSFAQQRLWFLDQLETGNSFYNVSRALRLRGALNREALSKALSEIVRRHESLRTSFDSENGTPFQRIAECESIPLPLLEMTASTLADREAEAEALASERVKQPFDLTRDPLLRASVFRIDDDDHVLLLTMHHIAGDGWSLGIMSHELSVLYESFANETPSPLSALPIQYADYAVWQREWLQGEVLERLVSYWKDRLAGAPTVLELPTDKPRPPVQTFRGAYESLTLSADLTKGLKQLSRDASATLFMTCLAAYQLLLSRYSGQQDFIVGTDVANRNRVETEGLIGFFTNLLPLRAKLSEDLKFSDLLRQVRETTLDAYAHQDLPFEKLVEELRPPRDLSRNPLAQALLVMQNHSLREIEMPGLQVSRFALPLESSRFDLVLFLFEAENGLEGLWLYNQDLFESKTIRHLSDLYRKLLENIVREPEARLDSYEILERETKPKLMDRKPAQATRLRGMRRKGVDLSQVSNVKRSFFPTAEALPLVIEPEAAAIELHEWATGNKDSLDRDLLHHGAILFRGFEVDAVPAFEQFASVMCPGLFGEYGDLPREEMGGKVYGSTPYPADETILFHNESSHMHRWPMYIFFYCVKAATQGGESPIIDCRHVYQSLDPLLREKFESKGLMYVRNFTDGLDVSWQNFFHTTERAAVEDYCRKAGIDFEWKSKNGLRTRQLCPAVITHPQTGEKVFFNQLQLHHVSCLAPAVRESLLTMMKEEDLPRNVYYGDGSPIEDSVMEYLGELYRQLGVAFSWQERDVLMLNNMLVAHSRNPFAGERKIVVALGNLVSKGRDHRPSR
jgi:amino acid adenylation domain-containing protein